MEGVNEERKEKEMETVEEREKEASGEWSQGKGWKKRKEKRKYYEHLKQRRYLSCGNLTFFVCGT